VLGDRAGAPLGVLERRRSDVHPSAPCRERRVERRVVADAAAHLDLDVESTHDLGQEPAVLAASERGVEVDQVDPLRTAGLPVQRSLDGVAEALL
jgi:hypothetical protein